LVSVGVADGASVGAGAGGAGATAVGGGARFIRCAIEIGKHRFLVLHVAGGGQEFSAQSCVATPVASTHMPIGLQTMSNPQSASVLQSTA